MVSCQYNNLTKYLHAALCARFVPLWRDVDLVGITASLAFYGQRNTAWPGNIRLKNAAGEWRVVVSPRGRIRLCERDDTRGCR